MKVTKPYKPNETDADVAIAVIMPFTDMMFSDNVRYSYIFNGTSNRTAMGDACQMSIKQNAKVASVVSFSLNRDSLYHILPEYLFHPIDRYLGTKGDPETFNKRHDEQEEQEKNAITYFKPFDHEYQTLRVNLQKWLNEHIFIGNMFLSDFITQGIQFNRSNTFIMAIYPCLAWLRNHRGSKEMMETALQYAFSGNADVSYQRDDEQMPLNPNIHSSPDGVIDDLFCGATFPTGACTWHVFYQTAIGTETRLSELLTEIREFSEFFQNWFLAIEDRLRIDFGDRKERPVLTSHNSSTGIFLNYSTQLI